jgi:UDP-N-acetylglucosamine--dolichyl-phosphate N-acetylglucosaminephosphotransferase
MNSAYASSLSRRETWRLLVLAGAGVGIIVNSFQGDGAPLVASVAFSAVAFALTFGLIRWLGPVFMRAGLKGKDMAKPRRPEMYEHVRIVAFSLQYPHPCSSTCS